VSRKVAPADIAPHSHRTERLLQGVEGEGLTGQVAIMIDRNVTGHLRSCACTC